MIRSTSSSAAHGAVANGGSSAAWSATAGIRTWSLLAGLGVALVLSLVPGVAFGGDGTDLNNSEGQGSLPSSFGGTGITLVGPMEDLVAVMGQVSGTGSVQYLDLDDSLAAVTLVGNVQVELSRSELVARGIDVELAVGDALAGGIAELSYGAWSSDPFFLPEVALDLPLGTLLASDGDLLPIRISALGLTGTRYQARIDTRGDRIRVRQESAAVSATGGTSF